jgi:hypothetical protein
MVPFAEGFESMLENNSTWPPGSETELKCSFMMRNPALSTIFVFSACGHGIFQLPVYIELCTQPVTRRAVNSFFIRAKIIPVINFTNNRGNG